MFQLNTRNALIIICSIMMSFIFQVNAATPTKVTKKVNIIGKAPVGTSIRSNKVMVKKGYKIVKVSDTKAEVMSRMKNNVTGSFECACSAGGNGCKVSIEGSSITCIDSGCTKGVCSMTVTIPKLNVLQ